MAEETLEPTEKGGNKFLIVLVILHMLATGALAFFLMNANQDLNELRVKLEKKEVDTAVKDEKKVKLKKEDDQEYSMGPLLDLGPITVNLRGLDGRDHLLRASLSLEVDSDETRREAESKVLPIRYRLSQLLAARRPDEMIGAEQMELVRKTMKNTADAVLASKTGRVLNVWPSEWLVE